MVDAIRPGIHSHTVMDLNPLENASTSQPLLQETNERKLRRARACQHIQAGASNRRLAAAYLCCPRRL